MGRKLRDDVTVYVTGEDGRPKALCGVEPSAEEAKEITNPDVWAGDGDAAAEAKPRRSSRSGD